MSTSEQISHTNAPRENYRVARRFQVKTLWRLGKRVYPDWHRCTWVEFKGKTCIQSPHGSRRFAVHQAHHSSLYSSSLTDPKYSPQQRISTKRSVHARRLTTSKACIKPRRVCAIYASCDLLEMALLYSEQSCECTNDPSAGSPTETLLRLLLPLSDKVH